METLINIFLAFLFFMFIAVTIVMVSGWLLLELLGVRQGKKCCGGNTCCKEKVEQEFCCKDDMSDCSCDEPFIIEGINDFERKTEITGMGGRGGPVDSVRSRHNEIEKQNEAYNKMIRESEDVEDALDTTPTNEPLEENDPNIHKK